MDEKEIKDLKELICKLASNCENDSEEIDTKDDLYEEFKLDKRVYEISDTHCIYNNNTLEFNFMEFTKVLEFLKNYTKYEEEIIFDKSQDNNLFEKINDDEKNTTYIQKIRFVNCKFNEDVYIKRGFEYLEFNNCIFEKRCYINNQYDDKKDEESNRITINELIIDKTKFNQNFKLHKVNVDKFKIKDTDFEKNADFYKSKFSNAYKDNKIEFYAINFNELAIFGEATFEKFLEFKYVTFRGYSHFRSSTFEAGLNLDYSNIQEEMNFFGVKGLDNKESKKNTTKETYRIIKHQLEKVGNITDANKYHSLELEKFCKTKIDEALTSCFFSKSTLDFIVLLLHRISSSYSTNWLLTTFWIFMISFFTNCYMEYIITIDYIFTYINITQVEAYEGHHIVFFFNKIALGYLYYQLLTAIRRNTRK
jgi:hypothetical protein